jgi:CpeT protein
MRSLIGRYDSAEQAARDPAFKSIHLVICPALAPELGERVLYVEQASADALDKPYRQRLYVVDSLGAEQVTSRVFELKNPTAAVGLCDRGTLARFVRADVEERLGCAVSLHREGTAFVGSTTGRTCTSTLRGAAWATSEVRLDEHGLVSWDRGFDEGARQVWGAVSGPYEFVRRTPGRADGGSVGAAH